jgi:hypothetical protein
MKLKEWPVSLVREFRLRTISDKQLCHPSGEVLPLIVSLTSIEPRLPMVHITVRSILIQKFIPEKIVLWLNERLKGKIPSNLERLQQSGFFEIRFTPFDSPHVKLLPALAAFPDKIIVTSDDDAIYKEGWLSGLYNSSLKNPGCVIANRLRTIQYDDNNQLLPYREWHYTPAADDCFSLPIGAEGALYPTGCFAPEVLDYKLALELAPKADDLWYKALSLKNGTISLLAEDLPGDSVPLRGTQQISLKKTNVKQDGNRRQWQNLVDYFKLETLLHLH